MSHRCACCMGRLEWSLWWLPRAGRASFLLWKFMGSDLCFSRCLFLLCLGLCCHLVHVSSIVIIIFVVVIKIMLVLDYFLFVEQQPSQSRRFVAAQEKFL